MILLSILASAAATSANLPVKIRVVTTPVTQSRDALDALFKGLTAAVGAADKNENAATNQAVEAAARALIAAAEAVPGDRGKVFAARGHAELAGVAHSASNIAVVVREANFTRALLEPRRDMAPDVYVQSLALLGEAASSAGRFDEAARILGAASDYLASFRAAGRVANSPKSLAMSESNIAFSLSNALVQLGRYDAAVTAQERSVAARVAAVGDLHPATIAARTHLATRLVRAGRPKDAEAMARTASEQAVAHTSKSDVGYVRSFEALALVLAGTGKRAEAVEVARRALDIRGGTTGRADFNYSSSLGTLAMLLVDLGRYGEAAPLLVEAVRVGDALGGNRPQADLQRQLTALGVARLAAGEAALSRITLERAFLLWQKERSVGLADTMLPALALARLDDGDAAGAGDAALAHLAAGTPARPLPPLGLAQACGIAALMNRDAPACASQAPGTRLVRLAEERVRATYDGELVSADRLMLEIAMRLAVRAGNVQLALDATRLLTGSKVAAATRLAAARAADGDSRLAARRRAYQDAEAAYRGANSRYLQALGKPDGAALRSAREAALAELETLERDLARDYPAWTSLGTDRTVRLDVLRLALAPDDTALGIVPTLVSTFVIAASGEAASVRRISVSRAVFAQQVSTLRTSIDAGAFDTTTAHRVYRAIFDAIDRATLRRARTLRIVASGEAATIPFATLLDRPAARMSRNTSVLVRRYAMAASASFASIVQPSVAPRLAGRLLALGAPTPFGEPATTRMAMLPALTTRAVFRGGGIDTAALSALPPLPVATSEAVTIARAFGPTRATLLIGDEASEDRIAALDMTPYRILIFATHALLAGEMEGIAEPALILARPGKGAMRDGVLTASDIGQLRLDADWVILSGCNTASGEGGSGSAYSGLAQAFRYAGARTMLLSQWPVRDDAAARLTEATLAAAARGQRPAQALRIAMLALIADRSAGGSSDPRLWAPFIVFE